MQNFRNECLKSIRYTETTTRVNATGGKEVKSSNDFQKLQEEDFNHLLAATTNPNSSNAPTARDLSSVVNAIGSHFGESNETS